MNNVLKQKLINSYVYQDHDIFNSEIPILAMTYNITLIENNESAYIHALILENTLPVTKFRVRRGLLDAHKWYRSNYE